MALSSTAAYNRLNKKHLSPTQLLLAQKLIRSGMRRYWNFRSGLGLPYRLTHCEKSNAGEWNFQKIEHCIS